MGSYCSKAIKFQLCKMKSSRNLLYILLIVNNTALHTQKFVWRVDLIFSIFFTAIKEMWFIIKFIFMQTNVFLLKNKYILQQLHFLVCILKLACISWLVVIRVNVSGHETHHGMHQDIVIGTQDLECCGPWSGFILPSLLSCEIDMLLVPLPLLFSPWKTRIKISRSYVCPKG